MKEDISPYICHVFVCGHDRQGKRKSCADGDAVEFKATLKKMVADKGWKPQVRVSQSGCMGLCGKGPNVIIYPQRHWFSDVSINDLERIESVITKELEAEPKR